MTRRIQLFFEDDSKNWTFFKYDSKNGTFFQYDSKKWTFFSVYFLICMTQRFEFFSLTQRIEPFFFEYDAKNWILFSLNITQRIEPLRKNRPQKIEPFFERDSKNWPFFFSKKKKRIELFCFKYEYDSQNWIRVTELNLFLNMPLFFRNWTLFWIRLKESNFFCNTTQRNEPFFSLIWLKELNLFFSKNYSNEWAFWCDSKNWTFFAWLTELNLF